ncbi:DUF7405 family protein [Halobacterium zhouii]|uniref:DUF7405 family protein n=1 Tax=Halobacterium zhouii TaxID=2902624 RepID=UPI001E4DFFBE|nr:DUF6293 family protein [Halobacterium zhouii]
MVPGATPERQHAWHDHVRTDDHDNAKLPRHQVLLYASLGGDEPPTDSQRDAVEAALSTLDDAYEWSNDGLLHSIAYSPAYFRRFDASLPDDLDLPDPEPLSPFEDPTFDTQDALVHLASDRGDVVLKAEHALTTYPIERPSHEHVAVLSFVGESTDGEGRYEGVTKGKILDFGAHEELPFVAESDAETRKGLYRRLDSRVLSPLLEREYVAVSTVGREKYVSLTGQGENVLRAFDYLL